ncbi:hypothetical protein [Flavobacterium sp.]|uniref:hypothetical protein n=1 Tax=Flavobacterium sp. TaxID=239 RepID=UPI002619D39F|nr:hypothetical protein [Flavobacterium sp.]
MHLKVEGRRSKVKGNALFFLLISCFWSISSSAQCAMCRAVLETEDGGNKAEAVNDGIVYLMVFPYLLVGLLAFVIYRMRTRKPKQENS